MLGAVLLAAVHAPPAAAFEVVPADVPGEYLKWGTSKAPGTPGGVVTWGFMAPGTPGSDYCAEFCRGRSRGGLPNFYAAPSVDNVRSEIALDALKPEIERAFEAWAAVADIHFRFVGKDHSLKPVNDPDATGPMIRIGIWSFSGMCAYASAGAAFPPGLNGGGGTGHVFLNANVGFQQSRVPEGARVQDFPQGGGLHMTDVYLLALHEIGHAIGLAASRDPQALMWHGEASAVLTPTYMRPTPRADDVAGAQFLYGPPHGADRSAR